MPRRLFFLIDDPEQLQGRAMLVEALLRTPEVEARLALTNNLPVLPFEGTCVCCGKLPHEHTDEELRACLAELGRWPDPSKAETP
jgi:hypothetical protein